MRGSTYFIFGLALVACGGGGGGGGGENNSAMNTVTAGPGVITIRWQANRETAVNRTGGGYRVYRATTSDFDAATIIDVPYQGGSLAPTQTSSTFAPGTYYLKVTAYSALNPAGSAASPVTALVVSQP